MQDLLVWRQFSLVSDKCWCQGLQDSCVTGLTSICTWFSSNILVIHKTSNWTKRNLMIIIKHYMAWHKSRQFWCSTYWPVVPSFRVGMSGFSKAMNVTLMLSFKCMCLEILVKIAKFNTQTLLHKTSIIFDCQFNLMCYCLLISCTFQVILFVN